MSVAFQFFTILSCLVLFFMCHSHFLPVKYASSKGILLCCLQGPTVTMKIHKYSLMKDVTAVQNKPRMPDTLWQVTAPVKLRKLPTHKNDKGVAGVMTQRLACSSSPFGRWVVFPFSRKQKSWSIGIEGRFSGKSLFLLLSKKQKKTCCLLAATVQRLHACHFLVVSCTAV